MVIEFPEERLPEISCIKRKLQTLEGVKIYMEPQQIRYPGFFLDTLQRKVMVEEKEVLLTAREFDVLAVMARHPGRVYTYAQICRMIYGETDVGEEMYSSAYCLISGLRKKLEKEKTITEDEQKKAEAEVQKLTDKFVADADKRSQAKEKEIMDI